MTLPTPTRKQWFLDRVGTRVWTTCKCDWCHDFYQHGKLLSSETHALIHYDQELSNLHIKYFSTKEERDEHERNM